MNSSSTSLLIVCFQNIFERVLVLNFDSDFDSTYLINQNPALSKLKRSKQNRKRFIRKIHLLIVFALFMTNRMAAKHKIDRHEA